MRLRGSVTIPVIIKKAFLQVVLDDNHDFYGGIALEGHASCIPRGIDASGSQGDLLRQEVEFVEPVTVTKWGHNFYVSGLRRPSHHPAPLFSSLSSSHPLCLSPSSKNMPMHLDFTTPVNTGLLIYIMYSLRSILFPSSSTPSSKSEIPTEFKSSYTWMPKTHPPIVVFKMYTAKSLEPFNGRQGGRILLAIDGTVFDVTQGANFYGPSMFPSVSFIPLLLFEYGVWGWN